jgi:hypothetical protein
MLVFIYVKFRKIGLYAECHYAECRCAECRYAECLNAECHYAECRCAECHYAECCGATQMSKIFKLDYFVVDSRII